MEFEFPRCVWDMGRRAWCICFLSGNSVSCFRKDLCKGCHPLGLEPDDPLAAAPPAGHFVAGLVLGDGNQMGFRA